MSSTVATLPIPAEILHAYAIEPNAIIEEVSVGNINTTFKITQADTSFIAQTINQAVFKNPAVIDSNLRTVQDYLKIQDPNYLFPAPVPAQSGATLTYDRKGMPWRLLMHIDNTDNFNTPPSTEHAYQAALAFASFTNRLSALPTDALQETIPYFHNVSRYETQLTDVLQSATEDRLVQAKAVISELANYRYIGEQYRASIKNQTCRVRIHHHDTKLNNLLFHGGQPTVKAIIDLDTIMPGYFYSDLGDLVMFGASAFEDETDLDKVVVNAAYYEAIMTGYHEGLRDTLSETEKALMPLAGKVMCYMLTVRFLTDYLAGEIYFKTRYDGQNLDKARNRLKLLTELDQLHT